MKMKLFNTRKDKLIKAKELELEEMFSAFLQLVEVVEDAQASARYYEALSEYLGDYIEEAHGEDVISIVMEWEGQEEYDSPNVQDIIYLEDHKNEN